MTIADRISRPGPKRLLALDGGGIRGMLSVEVLAAIEAQLRQRLGRGDDFVLADYFDYIAGTSTGAIIATLLSLGFPVARIREFYLEQGKAMFDRAINPLRWFRSVFRDTKLAGKLREVVGADTTLGSDRLRTLLMMVMRNASTDSPWPVSNNPAALFNDRGRDDCNLDLPLWELVRASTAAPFYFPPQPVKVGNTEFSFVDGGMTSYNNPAFLLFLMAALAPYNLSWPVGEDRMLLVSVGTGTNPRPKPVLNAWGQNRFSALVSVLMDPRFAALVEQDFLCRVFGRCRWGDPLDSELGDLKDPSATPFPKAFSYVRYNAELTRHGLDALGLPDVVPKNVSQLASVDYVDDLRRVGVAVAQHQVRIEHFEGFLNPAR